MALEHCFSIIKNKEKIEKVNIPDDFLDCFIVEWENT